MSDSDESADDSLIPSEINLRTLIFRFRLIRWRSLANKISRWSQFWCNPILFRERTRAVVWRLY